MVSATGIFVVLGFVLIFIAMIYMGSKAEEGNKSDKKKENEKSES